MKNKGFTLIEILAVIVLLGIVSVIAVVSVIGALDSSKRKIDETTISNVKRATELYFESNYDDLRDACKSGSADCEITTDKLISGDFLSEKPVDSEGTEYYFAIKPVYNSTDGTLSIDTSAENIESIMQQNKLASLIMASSEVKTIQDDDGTSYYYSGENAKNFVKIGNKTFRIIRVNGDGSVRLLYNIADNEGYTITSSKLDEEISRFKSENPEIVSLAINNGKFCENYVDNVPTSIPSLSCPSGYIKRTNVWLMSLEEAVLSNNGNNTNADSYIDGCSAASSVTTNRCQRIIIGSYGTAVFYRYSTNDGGSFLRYRNMNNNALFGVVRPVINISGTTLVDRNGNGTESNPYYININ